MSYEWRRIPRPAVPVARLSAILVYSAAVACSSESPPTGQENVEMQVSSYFLLQGLGGSVIPTAELTGPNNSANFTFTNTNDISGNKDNWHKYDFELQADDEVTLRVTLDGGTLLERSCTVHPRAITFGYAELIAYPAGGEAMFEAETPLPPGPSVHCACGFREYGDQRNADQCGLPP